MAEVKLVSSEQIPEQPLVRELVVLEPLEEDAPETVVEPELPDRSSTDFEFGGLDVGSTFRDSLQSFRYQLSENPWPLSQSSLLNPAETWEVTGVELPDEDSATVSIGRLGISEHTIALDRRALGRIDVGQEIMFAPRELIKEVPRRRFRGSRTMRVEFVPDEQQEPFAIETFIPVLRLHRPRHHGCKGVARFEQTKGEEAQGSISFLGIGGGKGEVLETSYTAEYPADQTCTEWGFDGRVELRFGKILVDDTDVGYGTRGHIERTSKRLRERAISDARDGCEVPSDQVPENRWAVAKCAGLDRTKATSAEPVWQGWEVEQQTKGSLSVGLDLGSKVPATISLEFLRTVTTRQTAGAYLAPGASYFPYYPSGSNNFEVCWTTR